MGFPAEKFMTLKHYARSNFKQDIPAGIIVALVSIPISMGYAQIAGLPAIYGLYGSLLPILIFGLISSSPRFVFGIDAAPCALVGSALVTLGIAPESSDALTIVPVITLFSGLWLLLFFLLKAGRLIKFISSPVMGGFISGIGCTIILMQLPKLFGGTAGTGELFHLLKNIGSQGQQHFHLLSLLLGVSTVLIIRLCARFIPRVPMSVVMMAVGALLTPLFHLEKHGVALLQAVSAGLPRLSVPGLTAVGSSLRTILLTSFTVSVVIVAETLLATKNYAMKHDDRIANNREIAAYAAANLISAFCGCPPANGSVSRTGIADAFGVKSQMMSVFAFLTMGGILLFGTGFIGYLPVPILTAIVIAALIGILEFDLALKLRKVDKSEFIIFWAAFIAVLILGTIYGVLIGIALSFITYIIRASDPPRDFLGVIPGQPGFYPLKRFRNAHAIKDTVIYRFAGSLFFANIEQFQQELQEKADEGCRQIIVDTSAMNSIDISAAEQLLLFYEKLKSRQIRLILAGHVGSVNDQLRAFAAEELIEDGAVRPTVALALQSLGLRRPYPLEETGEAKTFRPSILTPQITEFQWAYGDEAEHKMQEIVANITADIAAGKPFNEEIIRRTTRFFSHGHWSMLDEEHLLNLLQETLAHRLDHLPRSCDACENPGQLQRRERLTQVEQLLMEQQSHLEEEINIANPATLRSILEERKAKYHLFREQYPNLYRLMEENRQKHRAELEEKNPELLHHLESLLENLKKDPQDH